MYVIQKKYIIELTKHDVDAIHKCMMYAMNQELDEEDEFDMKFATDLDVHTIEDILDKLYLL